MDIVFDKGSNEQPKGHALLYFRSTLDNNEVWVTYLVILPIMVDLSKYVPPFLLNQVGEMDGEHLSAFAFPPAPERLGDYSKLEEIAVERDDDLVYAGSINPDDMSSAMMLANEATEKYTALYSQIVGGIYANESNESSSSDESVNDVLYGLMSEEDKLGELTKLVGRLQFAVDGFDQNLIGEAEQEINILSKHLPKNHSIPKLLSAVKGSKAGAAELAELYLQRCYHLFQEEYRKLSDVEQRIGELEQAQSSE